MRPGCNEPDTTAAIVGALAGIRWGLDEQSGGIAAEWLAALRGKDIVKGILARAGVRTSS